MDKTLAYETERYLRSIPLPKQTKSYTPLGHGAVFDISEEAFDKAGLVVTNKEFYHHSDGQVMTVWYDLEGSSGLGDSEMGLKAVKQNSLNKAATAKSAVGANVFACDNGMIAGEFAFKRKHTGSIHTDFQSFVEESLKHIHEYYEGLRLDKNHMRDVQIDKNITHKLLGEMFFEHQLITGEQMQIIKKEMKGSDNFPMWNNWLNPDRDNLWNLYNNVTESLKKSHSRRMISDHVQFHDIVKTEFGF